MTEAGRPRSASSTRSALWAVVGAMVGLRRRADFERDAAHLKPYQLIAMALALIAMFVGSALTIVHFVLH